MLDSNFDSSIAAFIARFKFVLFIFDPSHCKLIFMWLLIIACNYNINTIEVDNTVKHYGWIIGLEDDKSLSNLKDLMISSIFIFLIVIFTIAFLFWCFWWDKFKIENHNKQDDSPKMYKWYKIYEAFRFSFYIRIFVQVLMTIVLISNPLCKHIFDKFLYFFNLMNIQNVVFERNSTTIGESSLIFIAPFIFILFVFIVWILSIKFDPLLPTKYYSVEFFSGVTSSRNK